MSIFPTGGSSISTVIWYSAACLQRGHLTDGNTGIGYGRFDCTQDGHNVNAGSFSILGDFREPGGSREHGVAGRREPYGLPVQKPTSWAPFNPRSRRASAGVAISSPSSSRILRIFITC